MTSKEAFDDLKKRNEALKKEGHFHVGTEVMSILENLVESEPLIKLYQELTEINEVVLLYRELGNNFLLKKLESLGGGKRKQELLKEIKELKAKINGSQD